MSQRSAQFSSQGRLPEEDGDGADPTFATSMLGFGGVWIPRGGRPAR